MRDDHAAEKPVATPVARSRPLTFRVSLLCCTVFDARVPLQLAFNTVVLVWGGWHRLRQARNGNLRRRLQGRCFNEVRWYLRLQPVRVPRHHGAHPGAHSGAHLGTDLRTNLGPRLSNGCALSREVTRRCTAILRARVLYDHHCCRFPGLRNARSEPRNKLGSLIPILFPCSDGQ